MDLTMIVSKIYETEININFAGGLTVGKDYQRVSNIKKKIDHYIKLFHKCAKKIYSGWYSNLLNNLFNDEFNFGKYT